MALALDGTPETGTTTGGTTVTPGTGLTTSNTGDIIAMVAFAVSGTASHNSLSVTTTGGLSWSTRSTIQFTDGYSAQNDAALFWAYAASTVSGLKPIVSGNQAGSNLALLIFGVSGFSGSYSSNPWDTVSWNSAYQTSDVTGSGISNPSISAFATANSNTMVLGFTGGDDNGAPTAGNPSGSAAIATAFGTYPFAFGQHVNEASPFSGAVSVTGILSNFVLFADALSATGPGGGGDTLANSQKMIFMRDWPSKLFKPVRKLLRPKPKLTPAFVF